jgi:hypothetical protein
MVKAAMSSAERTPAASLLVDAHVHIHPCFALGAFLEGAVRGFQRGADELELSGPVLGALLLTESAGADFFRHFRDGVPGRGTAVWTFERTAEEESLFVRRSTGECLLLIAGRQIVCREGLEVLALATVATVATVPDRLPLAETLERVRESGALPVLPWGFGKWWGGRGRIAMAAVRDRGAGELYLGDQSGRLGLAPLPALLGEARSLGVAVLPGTDPLPFPRHANRAGGYGFALGDALDESRPAAELRRRVRALPPGFPPSFGRCRSLAGFVRDQAGMQWRQWRHKAASPAGAPVEAAR